jgi:hypothetical protein
MTSNRTIGPGEVASPAHSVSEEHPTSPSRNVESRLFALVASQREQGEANLGRSAQPDAIAPVAFNPCFDQKR